MPTLNILASDTTYVSKCSPEENFSATEMIRLKSDIRLGNFFTGLIKFDLPPFLSELRISRAVLYLYLGNHYLDRIPAMTRQVMIYRNLSDFNEQTATWSNRPPYSENPFALINLRETGCLEYVQCDITPLIYEWVDPAIPNNGITLLLSTGMVTGSVFFENRRTQHPPFILLEYCEPRPVPVGYDARIVSEFNDKVIRFYGRALTETSPVINISRDKNISVFMLNRATEPVSVHLQISPDGNTFCDDSQTAVLLPQTPAMVIPMCFGKYMRIVAEKASSEPFNVTAWYQSQSMNFDLEYPNA